MDILQEAWEHGKGLRGLPNILKINRHIAKASPQLISELAKVGVQVEIADAKEKSLPSSLRVAQDRSMWIRKKHEIKDRSLAGYIQNLCKDAQFDHDVWFQRDPGGSYSREETIRIQEWLNLPVQFPKSHIPVSDLDWEPGSWLSSWESSVPPASPRYFNFSAFENRMWLLTGKKVSEELDDDIYYSDDYYGNAAEFTKNLIACWPNPPVEIARTVGITLRELQWYTSGKAPLAGNKLYDLETLLGISYAQNTGNYTGREPYVLMAQNPAALTEVYEAISGGGDASPFEIIPDKGLADPSWRYVLINTYGEPPSIVMAPRGDRITDRLPDLLLNYSGIHSVSPEFYRDVVSTCARASREPSANKREMAEFAKRYQQRWSFECDH